jgi:hypothetical protein
MGKAQTNTQSLDKLDGIEVVLELLSFAGGENTISEDQAVQINQARVVTNWESPSLGGMERETGFDKIAAKSPVGTAPLDFLGEHKDSGGTKQYCVIGGAIHYKDSSALTSDDAGAFTSGVLCHGFSEENNKLWITNSTDNLKMKAVGVAVAIPASVPTTACARVYKHKNKMVAEGSASEPKRVYGSRTGVGNWTAADAWSLSNDAWSIDVPDATRGCVPNFPSGNEILVFTERNAYALSNFPNTSYRPIGTPSRGCIAPHSIALGDEGVYFLSRYPTLGVCLFDGVNFTDITELNRDVFVEQIDLTKRVYGTYRDRRYYIFYNEINSGVSYPNRVRIYNARFGRWMKREINLTLSDSFGYPTLLKYSNNELYIGSSQKGNLYDYDNGYQSDDGEDTEATYTTKDFSSRDFTLATGGVFPIDDCKIKLTKITVTYYGTVGAIGVQWTADRGLNSGAKTVSLTANGDVLNSTFIVNSSYLTTLPPDKTTSYTFPNNAVGSRHSFSFTNSGSSTIPKIKKVKIHGLIVDEA